MSIASIPEPEPGATDNLRLEFSLGYSTAHPNRFAELLDAMHLDGQVMPGDDYTAERDELFRDMTLDDMIAGIKQRRERAEKQL